VIPQSEDSPAGSKNPSIRSLRTILDGLAVGIEHPAEVFGYLRRNPGLAPIVVYACTLTKGEFGGNSTITLDIYQDLDGDDRYLTIYVRQERYDDDIIARMDRVCERYEPALTGLTGWLLLTTDYKAPHPVPTS